MTYKTCKQVKVQQNKAHGTSARVQKLKDKCSFLHVLECFMTKGLWTFDHPYVVFLQIVAAKLKAHNCMRCLCMLFNYSFPSLELRHVPAGQCPCAQIEVHEDIACQGWGGLHKSMTSTPLYTFGINWNADCAPGLFAIHQCLTSLNAFVAE